MILDRSAFFEHKKVISLKTINKGDSRFVITLNLPVGVYYHTLCLLDELKNTEDVAIRLDAAYEITTNLLRTNNDKITKQWVADNISLDDQTELINYALTEITTLKSLYEIPEIKVNRKTDTKNQQAKERQQKKEDIARLNNVLKGKKELNLMDDISIVMTKTSNTYKDILEMPILVFSDIVRTIVLNELRSDDDYNLAYLQYEYKKVNERLNNENKDGKAIETPAQNKGADVQGLKALLNK